MTFLCFEFEDGLRGIEPLCFAEPRELLVAEQPGEVLPALRRAQQAVDAGRYVAGYVGYEAAPAFDAALATRASGGPPLLWLGVFDAPAACTPRQGLGPFRLSDWAATTSREAYERDIAAIRAAIARGETYQVNYTLRLRARFEGDDWSLYRRLCLAQRARYAAYLDLGRYHVLSISPELFFQRRGARLTVRPMKGTLPRGRWEEEDEAHAAWLASSEKNRAENLMIVDLLRNDLGRIAEVGSVRVPELFAVERYPTVFQMTSTVEAQALPGLTLEQIFGALFPCGSVTGAPKASTMALIAALEPQPRGVYCGAVGFVRPGGDALFNVAIRTMLVDTRLGQAEYGVGGGITWGSTAADEYAEAFAKAALLREERPDFELLETMLLQDGVYVLLERHLRRLCSSARYFAIPLDEARVRALLAEHAQQAGPGAWRARLLVAQDGGARVEVAPLQPLPAPPLEVALAAAPISTQDRFLFHKTTNRGVYEARRQAHPQAFDVLLRNEREELTELTLGNLVVELEGRRWTPPLTCGLLPGTLRAELLETGAIQERALTVADLARATGLWMINSVRGWVPIRISSLEVQPASTI